MHHVIAPLDDDHVDAAAQLVSEVASALGIDPAGVASAPHLTIASYRGLAPGAAGRAVAAVAATVPPFRVRAHGYGMFVGDSDGDLSLHVMVVRTTPLDRLHARLHAALERTGARMDGLTRPDVWSPHITLLDRGLDPTLLGRAVARLACRPHRSWTVPIDSLAVSTGRPDHALGDPVPLTGPEP